MESLTVDEVGSYLRRCNLSVFAELFAAVEVDGLQLAEIEHGDLLELGDFLSFKRKALLKVLQSAKQEGIPAVMLLGGGYRRPGHL